MMTAPVLFSAYASVFKHCLGLEIWTIGNLVPME